MRLSTRTASPTTRGDSRCAERKSLPDTLLTLTQSHQAFEPTKGSPVRGRIARCVAFWPLKTYTYE